MNILTQWVYDASRHRHQWRTAARIGPLGRGGGFPARCVDGLPGVVPFEHVQHSNRSPWRRGGILKGVHYPTTFSTSPIWKPSSPLQRSRRALSVHAALGPRRLSEEAESPKKHHVSRKIEGYLACDVLGTASFDDRFVIASASAADHAE